MFKHRIKEPLKNGLEKGKRFFFFYGNGIKDYFLEDIYKEPLTLPETLKHFFLMGQQDIYRYFIRITPEDVIAFERKGDSIATAEGFFGSRIEQSGEADDLPLDEEIAANQEGRKQEESVRQVRENLQNTDIGIRNKISILKERIENAAGQQGGKRYAVLFEDFEWQANLYRHEPSAERIKMLKDFKGLEQTVVMVSLEDVEALQRFHFETKGSNVIYIGNPPAAEVKYMYLRKFLAGMPSQGSHDFQLTLFRELEEISYAISSGGKTLRDAIHVFEETVAEGSTEIHKEGFEKAAEKIIEEKILLADVILAPETKEVIVRAVDTFLSEDSVSESRKGFLLKGPSGTGKTQIVRALATEKNCYFMAPTLSELKGKYVGWTSAKVRGIFEEARANAPTILFIDEADTVFPVRDGGAGSDSFSLDMVNQFLQEIDGMKTGGAKVFTIAATNRPAMIDGAVKSRLSQEIEIGLPDGPARIAIFDSKLRKYGFRLSDKSYRAEIEKKSEQMSGRDIENFIKKLKEKLAGLDYKEIGNLKDDEESRNIFLQVLQDNELLLVEELRQKIPVEVEIPEKIATRLEDIIGYDDVKARAMLQAEFIRSSAEDAVLREKYGIKGKKGILLYGPPGNAKTELTKAIAKENRFYFIKVLSKDFASDCVVKQLENLQEIFSQALRLSKITSKYEGVLLFFEEFDSLAGYALNSVVRGTLLDLLANENGIRSETGKVLFVAATNHIQQLDEAVIRKGRIDEHIFMGNPRKEHGMHILRRKFEQDAKVNIGDFLIPLLYEKLHNMKYKEYLRKAEFWEKNGQQAQRLGPEDVRPSGSELVMLYKDIKAEAFFAQMKEGVLDGNCCIRISEETAETYFQKIQESRE